MNKQSVMSTLHTQQKSIFIQIQYNYGFWFFRFHCVFIVQAIFFFKPYERCQPCEWDCFSVQFSWKKASLVVGFMLLKKTVMPQIYTFKSTIYGLYINDLPIRTIRIVWKREILDNWTNFVPSMLDYSTSIISRYKAPYLNGIFDIKLQRT